MVSSTPRRRVIAGMAAFGLWGLARRLPAAESTPSRSPGGPLADRLAPYAHGLRYDHLDAATIAGAKPHFIDPLASRTPASAATPTRICPNLPRAPPPAP